MVNRKAKMKKIFLGTALLVWFFVFPVPTMARVDVGIHISLPPLIVFAAPPEVVVLPETNVYVVPDLDVDVFFFNGWWWRPWEGRWYRSRSYNSGWSYYRNVPSFYRGVSSDWRNDYREGRWKGRQWNHQRIPHGQVQRNWRSWEKSRHWEKQNSWGVQGLKPPKGSPQQKSEVRERQREAQPQHREAQQQKRDVKQSRPQRREAVEPQRSQSQNEKPERGEGKKHGRK